MEAAPSAGEMRTEPSPSPYGPGVPVVYAIAGALFGFIVGYIVATQQTPSQAAAVPAPLTASAPPGTASVGGANETELRVYRDLLARDPRNTAAAIRLGDLLYDARRYVEAIPSYQQAFALDPKNINVSTDLGTALWYTGRADDALAQYAKSLAIDPAHPQTLFNVGIVRMEGKQDAAGAIESWERLLKEHPEYPEAAKVQTLLGQARQRAGL